MGEKLIAMAWQPNTTYDMPKDLHFGGAGASQIQPLALVILLVASILILALPRKYVIAPLLVAGLLLPMGNGIVIGSLHLLAYRILLMVGWIRVLRDVQTEGGFYPRKWTQLDKVFLYWALSNAVMFCLLWGQFAAVVNRLGFLYTTLGSYFLVRHLIRDKDDVMRTIRTLAILAMVMAVPMLSEHLTGRNLFYLVGGPELASVREGKIRAQGPFAHSIIAGTIGAILIPLFVGLWQYRKRDRAIAGCGILAGLVMAGTSASSTPVLTIATVVLGFCLWPFRKSLKAIRWGLVIAIIVLHLIMKAPVWMLIARISEVLGGSGYHRAMLVDSFIRHFFDWCWIGTRDNASWGYDMWDSINTYVNAGTGGGLTTFVLFLAIMVLAYKRLGINRKIAERSGSLKDARFIWAIGVCLFAHTVAYFGIAYFDQSELAWYLLLALISATTAFAASTKTLSGAGIGSAATLVNGTVADGIPVERRTFASLLNEN
jgi:hypothetical protein